MKHATTRHLFSYWDELRGERAAPERGEIEPGRVRHILADTFVLELAPDFSAAFRLAGTRMGALFLRELRGSLLEGLWRSGPDDARRIVETVTEEMAGVVAGLRASTADGAAVDLELIVLPLRHRGRTHARALGALSFDVHPAWIGLKPVTGLETTSLRVIWPSGRGLLGAGGPSGAADKHPPIVPARRFVVHQGGRA